MSALIDNLRRMLAQAQGFARDAPLEALARAGRAVSEGNKALGTTSGEEREELESLLELAKSRVVKYEARLAEWRAEVVSRAAVYLTHERERLERPLAPKLF